MGFEVYFFALGIWFVLLVIAILNAGLREKFFKKHMNDLKAHQLSSLIFIIFIFVITFLWFKLSELVLTNLEGVLIGLFWFLLTLSFEFIAGHYLFGNSWKKLLEDYNVFKGRLWIFVLISLFIAPFLINKSLLS